MRFGRMTFGHPVCYGPEGGPTGAPAEGGGGTPPAGVVPPAPSGSDPLVITPPVVGAQPKWYEELPEGPTRDLMTQKAYESPHHLADAYHNLNKLVSGDDRIIIPPADAKPEDIAAFHTKLGRPEAADKYDIKMPDGVAADPKMLEFGKSLAFELGLNPKQAQQLADKWNEFNGTTATEYFDGVRQKNETEIGELKTKWGADLDTNVAAAKRAVQSLGLETEDMNRIEAAIGAAPLVKMMAKLGSMAKEGGFLTGNGGGDPNSPAGMTPQQAQSKVDELLGDSAFFAKYTNKGDPSHQEAVNRVLALMQRAGQTA